MTIPEHFNYIGIFLTLRCNLNCSYCINNFSKLEHRREMSGKEWIDALSSIQTKSDLPISLQGGEPTIHPDFYSIVDGLPQDTPLDLLTNASFDVAEFTDKVHPARFKREAPYASIRVSYHFETMDFFTTIDKVITLLDRGYSVGIWEIDHPAHHQDVLDRQLMAKHSGIDYRLKDFLGEWGGELYGNYKYPEAINAKTKRRALCRGSELLVDPGGYIFPCHAHLYANCHPLGHISDPLIKEKIGRTYSCLSFGACNPCDIKIKFNRYQQMGHCSCKITPIPSDA
jgi:MoaA/NifB/PqqE/SkfB family radical SAM enzyme